MKKKFLILTAFALCACNDESSSTSPSSTPDKGKPDSQIPSVETKCDFTINDNVWEFAYVMNKEITVSRVEFTEDTMIKYTMDSKSSKDAKACVPSEKIELNSIVCTDSLTYVVTQYAFSKLNEDGSYGPKNTTKETLFEYQMDSCKSHQN